MNKGGVWDDTLGQLGSIAKKTGQQIVKIPTDVVEDVSEQVGVKTELPPKDNKATHAQNDSEKDTQEFVKGLYAKSEDVQKGEDKKEAKGQPEFQKMIASKPIEEQKKLLQLHQQLHKQTYYDPTFNPPKRQEERPQEKIEKEEKEKKQMEALQIEEQKKKELSIAVKQGTHEKMPGISG